MASIDRLAFKKVGPVEAADWEADILGPNAAAHAPRRRKRTAPS